MNTGKLSDAELIALAALAQSVALGRRSTDEERLANGCSVAYGDRTSIEQDRLESELKLRRRGVL